MHCVQEILKTTNVLSSVIVKSSYISSKTNILWSYLKFFSSSLIANHIMIHTRIWEFFASFNFSYLMNFVIFSHICLYSVMIIMRSILIPNSTPDLSWSNSECVLCGLGALQTSHCSGPVLRSMLGLCSAGTKSWGYAFPDTQQKKNMYLITSHWECCSSPVVVSGQRSLHVQAGLW